MASGLGGALVKLHWKLHAAGVGDSDQNVVQHEKILIGYSLGHTHC